MQVITARNLEGLTFDPPKIPFTQDFRFRILPSYFFSLSLALYGAAVHAIADGPSGFRRRPDSRRELRSLFARRVEIRICVCKCQSRRLELGLCGLAESGLANAERFTTRHSSHYSVWLLWFYTQFTPRESTLHTVHTSRINQPPL